MRPASVTAGEVTPRRSRHAALRRAGDASLRNALGSTNGLGVAGLKAGALQPFGPWFVRPAGKCSFMPSVVLRRYRRHHDAGAIRPAKPEIAQTGHRNLRLKVEPYAWPRDVGRPLPRSGRIAAQAVSAAPWAAARSPPEVDTVSHLEHAPTCTNSSTRPTASRSSDGKRCRYRRVDERPDPLSGQTPVSCLRGTSTRSRCDATSKCDSRGLARLRPRRRPE